MRLTLATLAIRRGGLTMPGSRPGLVERSSDHRFAEIAELGALRGSVPSTRRAAPENPSAFALFVSSPFPFQKQDFEGGSTSAVEALGS